jgi:hypothetical protein
MKKIFFTLLFVAAVYSSAIADSAPAVGPSATMGVSSDYSPVVTHAFVREHKGWKTIDRYEYAYVDGYQETYNPEEAIAFSVEGKSDKLTVNETNGFSIFATMFNLTDRIGKRVKVKYDSHRNIWNMKLTAPKDSDKEYKIVINLFCKKYDSPCTETYGFGTQIDKTLPLKVR